MTTEAVPVLRAAPCPEIAMARPEASALPPDHPTAADTAAWPARRRLEALLGIACTVGNAVDGPSRSG
jgi:hypothetical protein